jgi:hypothetical protein
MSRGLSWRQRSILESIAGRHGEIVAWKDVDYGPTSAEMRGDYLERRSQWNNEQSVRRALRSLARRGLVETGRYVFLEFADTPHGSLSPRICWTAINPDDHVPGQTRIMTGVRLTSEGEAVAAVPQASLGGRA